MDSSDGKSGFFGAKRAAGQVARPDRRQFRPAVSGLEARQLMASSALSTLATFHGSSQSLVGNVVTDAQGDVFGSTSSGGQGGGTGDAKVFEIAAGSKSVTTLATFKDSNGYNITGLTLDGQGNLYGTIGGEGGAYGYGQAFEVAAGSKSATTLASFNMTNGAVPNALTIDAQGNLFGSTAVGGDIPGATAFEVAKGSGNVATLSYFTNPGASPKGLVTDAQGDLFGVDREGGPNGAGTVFEIAKGSGAALPIAAFGGNINGSGIGGLALDAQGNLYGTTENGGAYGTGTVFEIAKGSETVTTLTSFNGSGVDTNAGDNEWEPNSDAGVVMDAQGNLYGTTRTGGPNGAGTVFELAKGSSTAINLAAFGGATGGAVSGLKLDGLGHLYGTSNSASGADATVFKLTLNNQAAAQVLSTTSPTVTVAAETLVPAGHSVAAHRPKGNTPGSVR